MKENGGSSQALWILQRETCCPCDFYLQKLRGKILLKAKKIGGLETCLDETLTDEVSEEEEMANGDAESPGAEDPPAQAANKVVCDASSSKI